jgi:signal transduction protein with GAF and PtsI domain
MTETNGEIKPMPVPFEENAYKYADKQAELYRGLKEPSGGYANIVDAYIAGAIKETALLSQHILDLQKDKGNLTDRVRELEQQIEKMKKYIKACWVEENLNDYSSYITNTSDEFRDLVKELNEEIRNGR